MRVEAVLPRQARIAMLALAATAAGLSFRANGAEATAEFKAKVNIGYSSIRTQLELGQCQSGGDLINAGMAQNEAEAFYYAGFLYEFTSCVTEDLSRAARYYLEAAKRGDTRGSESLGRFYGLGLGVPQDYIAAYDWFIVRQNRGAPAAPIDPALATLTGYAMTVAHLARDKAVYPNDARRALLQASMEAVLDTETREVRIRYATVDIETGTHIARKLVFIDAVKAAYVSAVAEAPRPFTSVQRPISFATPWRFGWMRDERDYYVAVPELVSLGDTEPLSSE